MICARITGRKMALSTLYHGRNFGELVRRWYGLGTAFSGSFTLLILAFKSSFLIKSKWFSGKDYFSWNLHQSIGFSAGNGKGYV